MKMRKYLGSLLFGIVLTAYTGYVLLDTFVIPRAYEQTPIAERISDSASGQEEENDLEAEQEKEGENGQTQGTDSSVGEDTDSWTEDAYKEGTLTDSYEGNGAKITLYTYRYLDTNVYAADIVVDSAGKLRTALANNTYGKNVTEKTSSIASENQAVLAINGDFYGTRERGYVIRNGKLYREDGISGQEDLVIYEDGEFALIDESDITAGELLEKGAVQVFSFGPALIKDGEVSVSAGEEVGRAMASNPRTAVGQIGKNHYVFVVSDGRTRDNAGLSLVELAEFMASLGIQTAYNLDGGGSSTMYFQGEIVNHPTTSGRGGSRERSVSDIVYIGSGT